MPNGFGKRAAKAAPSSIFHKESDPMAVGNESVAPPKRNRFRWRFNLRLLFLLTALLAVLLASYSNVLLKARYERVIRDASGHSSHDNKISGETLLRTLSGVDERADILSLNLTSADVGDDDLALLVKYPNLQDLHLRGIRITDKGMVHVGRIPKLRILTLEDTAVTDEGLPKLERLMNLVRVRVGPNVSPAAATALAKELPKCYLDVTDAAGKTVFSVKPEN